ncbi:MAG: hypothetical protein WA931_10375, partial [Rhodococcus sp. (in: high G+C Gram-positive bacteria)]
VHERAVDVEQNGGRSHTSRLPPLGRRQTTDPSESAHNIGNGSREKSTAYQRSIDRRRLHLASRPGTRSANSAIWTTSLLGPISGK